MNEPYDGYNYYHKNKEKVKARHKARRERQKAEMGRAYYDKLYSQLKSWRDANSEKYKEMRRKQNRRRSKNNPNKKIRMQLRSSIRNALRNNGVRKDTKTSVLVGCSTNELKLKIESQFKDGMTWANYGFNGWHIDHIRPCASFDLSDPSQRAICFHWSNLQPLWAADNLKKSDNWEDENLMIN